MASRISDVCPSQHSRTSPLLITHLFRTLTGQGAKFRLIDGNGRSQPLLHVLQGRSRRHSLGRFGRYGSTPTDTGSHEERQQTGAINAQFNFP